MTDPSWHELRRPRLSLWLLLVTSFIVRWSIQNPYAVYFFPDERRFESSIEAAESLSQAASPLANLGNALRAIWSPHLMSRVVNVIPALLGHTDGSEAETAIGFSILVSVALVALMYLIARRYWGSRISLATAAIFAASGTNMYYVGHLLPYDLALLLGMAGIYVARSPKHPIPTAFAAGLLGSLGFLTYNGYWVLPVLCWLAAVARVRPGPTRLAEFEWQTLAVIVGTAVPILVVVDIGWVIGIDLLQVARAFSGTVTQGSFSEGWRFPFDYLVESDGLLSAIWLAGVAAGALRVARRNASEGETHALVALIVIYGQLAATSSLLKWFVVYGRLSRLLTPFLSVLAALLIVRTVERTTGRWRRRSLAAVAVIIVGAAAPNIARFQSIVYPHQFADMSQRVMEDRPGSYLLVNAAYLADFPLDKPVDVSGCELVAQESHAINFKPYQREGFTPIQRKAIREYPPQMQLWRC